MSGFYTPGLPLATAASLGGTPLIPVDTNLGSGVAPQSVAASPSQLGALFSGAAVTQTYGATLTINVATLGASAFKETLTGNQTLTLTNMQAGQTLQGQITQDGTGSRVITVAAGAGGATVVSGTPLSTAASSLDLVAIKNIGTFALPIFAYYPIAKALA